MNPWLLAGLVFGVIGLIQEAMAVKEDPKKSKVKTPAKAGDTIVNVGGQRVETPAQKAAAAAKKEKEKPKVDKPSDG